MTVTNSGDTSSQVEPLSITLPDGVQVDGVDVGTEGAALRRVTAGLLRAGPIGPCVQSGPTCSVNLPAVSGHAKVDVTVSLSATPQASSGDIVVNVFGNSVSFALTVTPSANLTVALAPSDPLLAGGTGELTATVTNEGGQASAAKPIVVDLPNGIALTDIRSGETSLCATEPPSITLVAATECTLPTISAGNELTLTLILDVDRAAVGGPVTVSIGNPVEAQDATTVTVLSPAALIATNFGNTTLVAGGSSTATATVGNVGDQASTPSPVSITLPAGVQVGAILVGSSSIPVGPCASPSGATCAEFPAVPGKSTVGVTVTLTAGPQARSGQVEVVAFGARQTFTLTIVQPAQLSQSKPTVSLISTAGGNGAFSITVSNLGDQASAAGLPIDLTLPTGISLSTVTVSGANSCTTQGTPTGTVAAALACTLPSIPGRGQVTVGFYLSIDTQVAGTGFLVTPLSVPLGALHPGSAERDLVDPGHRNLAPRRHAEPGDDHGYRAGFRHRTRHSHLHVRQP